MMMIRDKILSFFFLWKLQVVSWLASTLSGRVGDFWGGLPAKHLGSSGRKSPLCVRAA